MNIGSEMPKLLYGNETVAIFQGVCGIIIYDISDSTVVDRLTIDFLKNKGIFMLSAGVLESGKTILISNIDWSMSSLQIVIYDYNIGSELIYNIFD